MRNPNGFGSVSKLSGNRRRPYMVREGRSGACRVIGFAATRAEGIMLLAEYNRDCWSPEPAMVTLSALYRRWLEQKAPRLGRANLASMKTAYRHIAHLSDRAYRELRAGQMQDAIDHCGHGYSTQGAIKNLWVHLDRFAFELDIIDKQYSALLTSAPVPVTRKRIFTDQEIQRLWAARDLPHADTVLLFLYTGFRISELLQMRLENVHLEEGYMQGGVKTQAGRDRIVPIHPRILPIVRRYAAASTSGYLLEHNGGPHTDDSYRKQWNRVMKQLDMRHTPHEARHTLRSRLDSAGANKVCIDRIMGHRSQGVGEAVYTHKSLQELQAAIQLLP